MEFKRVKPKTEGEGNARLPEKAPGGGVFIFSAEAFKLGHGEMKNVGTGFIPDIPAGSALVICETSDMGLRGVTVIGGTYTNGLTDEEIEAGATPVGELVVNLTNNRRDAFEVSVGSVIGLAVLVDIEEFEVEEAEEDKSDSDEDSDSGVKGPMKPSAQTRHGQPNTNPQNVGVGSQDLTPKS